MPQENVDIVRRVYEAFSSRDFDAIAQLGHPMSSGGLISRISAENR